MLKVYKESTIFWLYKTYQLRGKAFKQEATKKITSQRNKKHANLAPPTIFFPIVLNSLKITHDFISPLSFCPPECFGTLFTKVIQAQEPVAFP